MGSRNDDEELEVVEPADCLRLLAAHHFGRLAFGGPG